MIGDVYEAYFNHLDGVSGYTANQKINDEGFMPASNADKSFFLEIDGKDSQDVSGNEETIRVHFVLKVVYKFPHKNKFSVNQKAAWNNIGSLERGLINFANGRADLLNVQDITLEDISTGWKLAEIKGFILYQRSMST